MAATTSRGRGPAGDRSFSFTDWLQLNARAVAIGAVAVAAVGAFVFIYQRYTASTARQAEQAYFAAQGAPSQNPQDREKALDAVIGRFDGTPAATQAAMLVAQQRYDRGAYKEGIGALQRVEGHRASAEFEPALDALIAAGLEGRGDFRGAAAKYREAAEAARFEIDRDNYMADAARALRRAGDEAEAVRIWTELAERPASPVAAEAQVRLGELSAKPAGRG